MWLRLAVGMPVRLYKLIKQLIITVVASKESVTLIFVLVRRSGGGLSHCIIVSRESIL